MTHKTEFLNADGLVQGYGPNFAERQAAAVVQDAVNVKVAKVQIDLANSTFGSAGARIAIPAGSIVKNVYAKITETHVGGTSLTFGDAVDPDGWVLAASWGLPVSGDVIQADGAYAVSAGAQVPPKEYAVATDLYFTKVGTYTAGKADVYVEYV
jgi:hypothetical protein